MSASARVPSGISGLDEMLGGGFPRDRVILVLGGPGAGKTILCTQFLVSGIKRGEAGLLVSLDESKEHLYREMSPFGWDLDRYEKEKKFAFVDASPIRKLPGEVKLGPVSVGKRDFSLISLIELIRRGVESVGAKRIFVDAMASMTFNYSDPTQLRTGVLDLIEALINMKATCLLTTEQTQSEFQVEGYLAHGVIQLQTAQTGKNYVRSIQVAKMRETKSDLQPRPYKIESKGIEVYAKETIF